MNTIKTIRKMKTIKKNNGKKIVMKIIKKKKVIVVKKKVDFKEMIGKDCWNIIEEYKEEMERLEIREMIEREKEEERLERIIRRKRENCNCGSYMGRRDKLKYKMCRTCRRKEKLTFNKRCSSCYERIDNCYSVCGKCMNKRIDRNNYREKCENSRKERRERERKENEERVVKSKNKRKTLNIMDFLVKKKK